MTWYFEAHERTIDVWDHNADLVATDVEFSGVWEGNFPDEVYAVMRAELGSGQPSAYNQLLIADAATDNIKEGTPPAYTAESRPEHSDDDNNRDTPNE